MTPPRLARCTRKVAPAHSTAYTSEPMSNSGFSRVVPAIGLFFLAPFISEYLLGDFSLTKLGYLSPSEK